jgi:hypothetical protein
MMDRRRFLLTSLAGALTAPLASGAQPRGKVPRIGFVLGGAPSAPISLRVSEAFRQGLREYGGYVEGQSIVVEYRSGCPSPVPVRLAR